MKHFFILVLLSVSFFLSGFSQNSNGSINGTVTDASQNKLEAATVALLKATDSASVTVIATNKLGKYAFTNIGAGNYLVCVTAVGYQKRYSLSFAISASGQPVVVANIALPVSASDLSTVTVTGHKQMVEQKIDRMVVNVDAAVTNTGSSALEVLEKSPGITVDKDGNISLKGKQQVLVMIDGKPSYLSGAELVNLLKNMSASQLEQIEIMTNPPAKYDAAGNSGVINIKTKKNKQQGFNGSVSTGYSQGKYWRTNNSLNLNYRTGRVNTFMNLSYNKNNNFQQLEIHRAYANEDKKTINAIFDQTSNMKNVYENANLKAGMDFFVNKNTTLGFVATGFIAPSVEKGDNISYLKNGQGIVDSLVHSTSSEKARWSNGTMNVNFRRQFDTAGTELTADLDYARYSSANRQEFTNTSFQPDWTQKNQNQLLGILPINISIYSAKSDYTRNLKHGIKFEAGWKSSYVHTDNTAGYYNFTGGDWTTDYSKTNSFKYTENINAAYVNFNRQFKKLGVQAGLRYENTSYKGVQDGNSQKPDSSFRRTYNNLFPTVFISYAASKNNQLGLNVGRRIDRPAYQDLNPFLFFMDNYTYNSGNPYLKPQYATNIELSNTYKGFLTTTVNYSQTKNFFMETFEQSGYATIVRNGNIGVRKNAGIAVSAQIPVQKWWSAMVYTNYNYSKFSGELYGEQLNVEAGNLMVNINNQFKFSNGWSAELSGWYRTKGVEGQIMISDMGQISTGVSKQVLHSKGSIRFNIRDMFAMQKAVGHISFQKTDAHFVNTWDTRLANITFTYRFGKPLKDVPKHKDGGSSDEQNRVKAGGN